MTALHFKWRRGPCMSKEKIIGKTWKRVWKSYLFGYEGNRKPSYGSKREREILLFIVGEGMKVNFFDTRGGGGRTRLQEESPESDSERRRERIKANF